jgi:hypothetical protein
MYVARVPNRNSPRIRAARRLSRERQSQTRTLTNLSHWPMAKIERLARVLRDEVLAEPNDKLTMLRSLPHGHVAAVLGTARKIGLERLPVAHRSPTQPVALVLAMIVARILDPASKLATDETTATCSLGPLTQPWQRDRAGALHRAGLVASPTIPH